MDHIGEILSTVTGVAGLLALTYTWLKGGFKKQTDWDDAVSLVNKHEELSKTRGLIIESLTLKVAALEKDHLEIKRNTNDQFQQMFVKMDDNNKLLMELMFKIGELTGRSR